MTTATTTIDERTRSTLIAATVHYALHVADPRMCAEALDTLGVPDAAELVDQARRKYRALLDEAA